MIHKRLLAAAAAAAATIAAGSTIALPDAQAASTTATVVAPQLAVREAPNTSSTIKSWAAQGSQVTIECQTAGQAVTGNWGSTEIWNRVNGGYVSDGWVDTGTNGYIDGVPKCDEGGESTPEQPNPGDGTYFLPFAKGSSHQVTQGPGGGFSHYDQWNRYAVDFGMPVGTGLYASAPGTVIFSGEDQTGYGNMVLIDHGDNRCSQYAHMDTLDVSVNTQVEAGTAIGTSGNSGYSSGPHLHWGIVNCQTRDSLEVPNTPEAGQNFQPGTAPTSQNPGN